MSLANSGPQGWWRALHAVRESPDFLEQERDFIGHGGTTAIQGKTFEAYHSMQPGLLPSWGDIWKKAPVVSEMDTMANKITEFTFGKLQRQMKVTDYALHKAGWLSEHPNTTPQEEREAFNSIAKELNGVYGGLNWERIGINRSTVEVARALMLAPDWTFSNIFSLKYATEGGTKAVAHQAASAVGLGGKMPATWEGSPAGKLSRAFWLRAIIGGMIATQLLSLLLSRKPSKRLTQVYMGKDKQGREIYQNVFFKGAPGDAVNLVNNIHDYGAVLGLSKTLAGKLAPVWRTGMQLATNQNYLHQTLIPKGMHPLAATARGVLEIGKGVAPTPLSVTNIKDMLVGPGHEKYTAPEFLTTTFAGTPPSHVAPEGMRWSKGQLRTKRPDKPRQSVLKEILTGKP
jgi:hypothetical protein